MKYGFTVSLLVLAVLTSCAAPAPKPPISAADVPEIRAGSGILIGYLPRSVLPDSLALLPPPPAPNSAAFAADEDAYKAGKAVSAERRQMAISDTNLSFPKAAEVFSCSLGIKVTEADTPNLYMLLRRTLADAGLSTYGAKDHYKRVRPFVQYKERACDPAEEPRLVNDGSYPSGHSALGWAWALVLAEIAPERSKEILARGYAFGQSRVICGVHWQSDVDAGRVMGAAAVARLHADSLFLAQKAEAAREYAAAKAKVASVPVGQTAKGDCGG